jgi:hypothetical protein
MEIFLDRLFYVINDNHIICLHRTLWFPANLDEKPD